MSRADKDAAATVPWILWGAFLTSHAMFLIVGLIVHGQSAGAELGPLPIVLSAAGFITALASALLVPVVMRKQVFFTALILRFATAESASIFGLVLAMLGAELEWVYLLTGLGVLAHLTAAPTQRERERHERGRERAA